MYDDDEDWSFGPRRQSRSARVFLNRENDNQSNIAAWKSGIISARSGDAAGVLEALLNARGSIIPYNTRGNPARNFCAKAILNLETRPDAWRRLREGSRMGYSGEAEGEAWKPSCVDIFNCLWAHNPQTVAEAALLWRQNCESSKKWWSCPFLSRPYTGAYELKEPLRFAMFRLFEPSEYRFSLLSEPESIVPMATDQTEREAVRTILAELTRACVDELWTHADSARKKRAEGDTVWARGGSEMGLNWRGASVALEAAKEGEPATISQEAATRSMEEAIAQGESSADLACCKWAIGYFGAGGASGAGSIVAAETALSAWLKARPNDPKGLPFDAFDWLAPDDLFSLCNRAGVSDQALGRWLQGAGASWSQPAGFSSYSNRSESLVATPPYWSINRGSFDSKLIMEGMGQWGPLEWALKHQPQAAREACLLGAKLASGLEGVFAKASELSYKKEEIENYAKIQAWAEACKIAEVSNAPIARASKRSLSI